MAVWNKLRTIGIWKINGLMWRASFRKKKKKADSTWEDVWSTIFKVLLLKRLCVLLQLFVRQINEQIVNFRSCKAAPLRMLYLEIYQKQWAATILLNVTQQTVCVDRAETTSGCKIFRSFFFSSNVRTVYPFFFTSTGLKGTHRGKDLIDVSQVLMFINLFEIEWLGTRLRLTVQWFIQIIGDS